MPANSLYDEIVLGPNMVTGSLAAASTTAQPPMDDPRALSLALELIQHENFPMQSFGDGGQFFDSLSETERANKRSQNMTECVAVPSSEHVAEIVGRQGCKIKALRAKTNTYIKTPVRGEEPVFVVTGRKEDVASAKKEILSAAEHFSQIRACRKNNMNGSLAPGPPTNVPGQLTISVRVPYRVVGLVVGPKGATIKRIQQQTQTYIVTPSRDKEPVFEVTGLPDSVEAAKKEIESHIAMRTGTLYDDDSTALSAFAANHNIGMETLLANPDLLAFFRQQQQQQQQAAAVAVAASHLQSSTSALNNGIGSASLNAMLSTNSSTQNLGSNLSSFNMNSFSNGLASGFGNGQSNLGSLSNGLNNHTNNFSNALGTSAIGRSMLNDYSSALQTSTFNPLNSLGGLNLDMNQGSGSNTSSNGSNNFLNNFGSHNNLNSATNQLHPLNDFSNFDLLGENAANLLNGNKPNGIDSTMFQSLGRSINNFGTSSASVLPTGYGVDEGLGSLESSMGSSPALDQPPAAQNNIWSSQGIGFSLPNKLTSGDNSPSQRLSPNFLSRHSLTSRSNSDSEMPQLSALSVALSNLSGSGTVRSNTTSPEVNDLTSKMSSLASSVCSSVLQPLACEAGSSPITTSAGSDVPTSGSAGSLCTATSVAAASMKDFNDAAAMMTPIISSATGLSTKELIRECAECKKVDRIAAIIPCGHHTTCLTCAHKRNLETATCHVCDAVIESVIELQ